MPDPTTAQSDTGPPRSAPQTAYRLHSAHPAPVALQVALLGAAPLVERGLLEVLGDRGHRLHAVGSLDELPGDVDAVLVDVGSLGQRATGEVAALVAAGVEPVLCLGRSADPEEWQRMHDVGADGYLSVWLPTRDLVGRLEHLVADGPDPAPRTSPLERVGCTEREAEILTLIAHGMSNKEISAELFLGLNTIKTYIRSAYRKIGVTTRSHAVIWGIEHGI